VHSTKDILELIWQKVSAARKKVFLLVPILLLGSRNTLLRGFRDTNATSVAWRSIVRILAILRLGVTEAASHHHMVKGAVRRVKSLFCGKLLGKSTVINEKGAAKTNHLMLPNFLSEKIELGVRHYM
jgi:hypothetical protein